MCNSLLLPCSSLIVISSSIPPPKGCFLCALQFLISVTLFHFLLLAPYFLIPCLLSYFSLLASFLLPFSPIAPTFLLPSCFLNSNFFLPSVPFLLPAFPFLPSFYFLVPFPDCRVFLQLLECTQSQEAGQSTSTIPTEVSLKQSSCVSYSVPVPLLPTSLYQSVQEVEELARRNQELQDRLDELEARLQGGEGQRGR